MVSPCSPHIVIIGAGFGGLQTAVSLGGTSAQVTLIDRYNYHTFIPLLYQVATATLEPEWIAVPIQSHLRRWTNVHFLQSIVEQIDYGEQRIITDQTTLKYDYLVLSTGSQTHFRGVPGAQKYAFPLRTLTDAIALKHHLLQCIEEAAQTPDPDLRRSLLTFTLVGGGATGVEMAGALVELCRRAWPKDYPFLRQQPVRLLIVQSGAELLPEFRQPLRTYTYKRLMNLGVEVQVNTKVTAVYPTHLVLDTGVHIPCATTIWTTGVTVMLPQGQTLPQTAQGKIWVLPSLQLQQYPEVYAIGDIVQLPNQSVTGLAPVAVQQGTHAACNLRRQLKGYTPQPFRYFHKGRLAMIGCFLGVGQIGPLLIRGLMGWLLCLVVHWIYVPGYRSRLIILLTWLQSFMTGNKLAQQQLMKVRSPSTSTIQSPS